MGKPGPDPDPCEMPDWVNQSHRATKGRGVAKGKPKPVTIRVFKTNLGSRITIENRKGLDGPGILAALEEATARARGELAEDQAAA
jgi:hypothetical protein